MLNGYTQWVSFFNHDQPMTGWLIIHDKNKKVNTKIIIITMSPIFPRCPGRCRWQIETEQEVRDSTVQCIAWVVDSLVIRQSRHYLRLWSHLSSFPISPMSWTLLHMKGHQKGGRSSVTTPWPMCQRRRRTMFGFEEDSYKSGHPGPPRPCPLLIGTTWIENPTSKSTSAPPLLLSYKAMLQISWSSWGEAFHQEEPLI